MYKVSKNIHMGLLAATMLLAATLFASCKDDDGNQGDVVAPAPRVQVMALFSPGQLSDLGYAARVMKGVNTLKNADMNADSVEVNFIVSNDVETTTAALAEWAGRYQSPLEDVPYSRRLLVLTEPFMVEWVAAVKDRLMATDEVLLLKVNGDDVEAAAQKLGMEGRIHGLNISAAGAIKHLEETRREFYKTNGSYELETHILRLYTDSVQHYRDSISETIKETLPDSVEIPTKALLDGGGELYRTAYVRTLFQSAYSMSAFYWSQANLIDSYVFVIVDLGAANSGTEFFLMNRNDKSRVIMVALDSEPNSAVHRCAIVRHFDRALAEWTALWVRQPLDKMPLMQQHGAWDGYCTNDIDLLSILYQTATQHKK